MNVSQALNILKPESNTAEALKAAYRAACKRYHPDINPDGAEIMKLINAAYDFLKKHLGQWSTSQRNRTETPIDEIFSEILNRIRHFPGIHIEVCGNWLWITGNTRPYREALKAAGLRWAHKKRAWYWRPEGYRKKSRRVLSLDEIRFTFGSREIETEKREPLRAAY
jgi:hypothetical protein